jgi:hypothetical protein
MPLQINAVGSHAKIPQNKSKGEITNDACSAKRRSYARRHGKGIMAVYEVFRWWRGGNWGGDENRYVAWTRHVSGVISNAQIFSSHRLTV